MKLPALTQNLPRPAGCLVAGFGGPLAGLRPHALPGVVGDSQGSVSGDCGYWKCPQDYFPGACAYCAASSSPFPTAPAAWRGTCIPALPYPSA
jgi:hypothetical protein